MNEIDQQFAQENHSQMAKDGANFDFCCKSCAKVLGKFDIENSHFDLRCHRCGKINSILYFTDQQIYLTDSTGKILFTNEQVEQVTGYSASEVIGKTPAIWGGQMAHSFYKKLWEDIFKSKKPIVVSVTNRRKNGQTYKAYSQISPILNEKGKVSHFLGIQTVVDKTGKDID
jgi:PAS domain S-box-containing protein